MTLARMPVHKWIRKNMKGDVIQQNENDRTTNKWNVVVEQCKQKLKNGSRNCNRRPNKTSTFLHVLFEFCHLFRSFVSFYRPFFHFFLSILFVFAVLLICKYWQPNARLCHFAFTIFVSFDFQLKKFIEKIDFDNVAAGFCFSLHFHSLSYRIFSFCWKSILRCAPTVVRIFCIFTK